MIAFTFSRHDSAVVNEQTMKEYVGTYHSDEVEASNKIEYKNATLFFTLIDGRGTFPLTPTYKDGFSSGIGPLIFERNKNGKIIGYSLTTGRARNMGFKKIE